MNLDVLFIILPKVRDKVVIPTLEYLGVGYLASILEAYNFKSEILDCYNYDIKLNKCVEIIFKTNPKIIGITAPFALELVNLVRLVDILRKKGYKGHITVGGNAVALCKEKIINKCEINSLALGESENTFPTLVKDIIDDNVNLRMKGYWFREKNSIYRNSKANPLKDLNKIPFPKRKSILGKNITILDKNKKIATIITSRGCPFRCKFCTIHSIYCDSTKRVWRGRSSQNVVDEIEYLVKNAGITIFNFADDNFLGNCNIGNQRAIAIADEVIQRNLDIKFCIETRVDAINIEVLHKLKLAGLETVMLGVESGVQRMLDFWRKDITVEQSIRVIKLFDELGVRCNVNFILYDMFSNLDEMDENYKFIKNTQIYKNPYNFSIFENRLAIFPETKIEKELKNKNILKKWEFYNISKENQAILNELNAIQYYKIIDKNMRIFLNHHFHWVNKIVDKLEHLPRVSPDNNINKDKYIKWKNMIGYLAIKLFKHVIDGVRNTKHNINQELDELMDDYDYKVLGNSFFDKWGT